MQLCRATCQSQECRRRDPRGKPVTLEMTSGLFTVTQIKLGWIRSWSSSNSAGVDWEPNIPSPLTLILESPNLVSVCSRLLCAFQGITNLMLSFQFFWGLNLLYAQSMWTKDATFSIKFGTAKAKEQVVEGSVHENIFGEKYGCPLNQHLNLESDTSAP